MQYAQMTLAVDPERTEFLYQQVVDLIGDRIEGGDLRPGDRLPSLRKMSRTLEVSIPTVRQAYIELERHGRVEARPKSGYYVRARQRRELVRPGCKSCEPRPVNRLSLVERVYEAIHRPGYVPFGIANPSMALPASKALHRTMRRIMTRSEDRSLGYAEMTGEPTLKRQLAHRFLQLGGDIPAKDILITNGGQEALSIALLSVCKPGDVVAVESPTYHGLLELLEANGMLALEIETCPTAGIVLSALERALDRHRVAACIFSSVLNNPLGAATTDDYRRELVALLEQRRIPLIEDDVYGDLLYAGSRPRPAQFLSRSGLVLTCGSFSKTVAPGYRIGWLLPGKYGEAARRHKRSLSCSSGLLQQLTLADFLASGEFERHLRRLLPVLERNANRMSALVAEHFPAATRVSHPAGGSVLWIELPKGHDSAAVFNAALDHGISIAPGLISAPSDRYRNFIRLSYGHPWTEDVEQALKTLGSLITRMR
ncbi:MAG: PLP-dependent aminotransferase family protein [Xanthomonadales bacterium]|nr:PLP-dependent aminotransferase family protein [Xanthomonadales bacterium]